MGFKPCIRSMRVTVSKLVGFVAARRSPAEILGACPYLEQGDIRQVRGAASDNQAPFRKHHS
jgi:uncharacterized protein (DUF433 family)